MTDLARPITSLAEAGVRLIVVGGMAGVAHGSARVTFDIDCVYDRDPDDRARFARASAPVHPTLRDAPCRVVSLPGSTAERGDRRPRRSAAGGPARASSADG